MYRMFHKTCKKSWKALTTLTGAQLAAYSVPFKTFMFAGFPNQSSLTTNYELNY